MKKVYEASHGVEAHMIADLLRQQGIRGRVEGEYLVGAMGGLPASGLVRVVVEEEDYEPARRVIEGWSAQQAEETAPPQHRATAARWPYVALGVMLGVVLSYAASIAHNAMSDTPTELCRP